MNLKYVLPAMLFLPALLDAAPFTVNGKIPESGYFSADGKWVYERQVDIAKTGFPAEFLISSKAVKKHPKHPDICGYGGNIILRITAPGPIAALECGGTVSNFADKRKRHAAVEYSLNGIDYQSIDTKDFGAGSVNLYGKTALPENWGLLFIKFSKKLEKGDNNGRYGYILFRKINIRLTGSVQKSGQETRPGKALKSVFPTGVFWAWERTKPNAELAKKELWTFAEENLKLLRENGYDTCWFVNFSTQVEDQLKMLELAAKYGMKVLFNGDYLDAFYSGINSLESLDTAADRTAARLGHHDALLGYVLKDEPVISDLETCNYLYSLMKQADPLRDSVAVVMNQQSLSYLRDSKLPVICSDIYYFSHDHSTQLPSPRAVSQAEFTNALKSYGNAAELYGKHSWFMGQMFGNVWGRHWFNGKKMVVYPVRICIGGCRPKPRFAGKSGKPCVWAPKGYFSTCSILRSRCLFRRKK